jgi:prepilin-type processing-associated H-X9-DG protein
LAEVTDGMSNTLLVGEKHVPLDGFGLGPLDNSIYNSDRFYSSVRSTHFIPLATSLREPSWSFGSYHKGVCQFVYFDGSVHALPTSLPLDTLMGLTTIKGGEVIPAF